MTFERSCSLIWLGAFFLTTLSGCQPNIATFSHAIEAPLPTAPKPAILSTEKVINFKESEAITSQTVTLQWASDYQWQLAQVKNQQGQDISIQDYGPIRLELAPSSLNLAQGCQYFSINFIWMSAPPFQYATQLNEMPNNCKDDNGNKISTRNIKTLLPQTNDFIKLDIELLPLTSTVSDSTQIAPKNLMIEIENGNTFIFSGMPKTFKKSAGLSINNALLERYDWQLVSAVSNTFDDNRQIIARKPIGDFYHPDFPVSLTFLSHSDGQYAFFNSSCNGVGGPYILMKDYTLLVGSGPQTMMGCGPTGNRIESALAKLVTRSKSKLNLSLQPSNQVEEQTDLPHYNLLQTMDSGETLVWQNAKKQSR